jgi:hypothetical protein
MRLLVVADIWCEIEGICTQVRRELDCRESEVLVVAPPLASRIHTFDSDTDHETENARVRLAEVLARFAKHGIEARGMVGAHDPRLAIDDALAIFSAEKILVVTDTADHQNWREHHLPRYLEGLDVPVVRLFVPHDLVF